MARGYARLCSTRPRLAKNRRSLATKDGCATKAGYIGQTSSHST
jgi:hypothetical protein